MPVGDVEMKKKTTSYLANEEIIKEKTKLADEIDRKEKENDDALIADL